MRKYFVLHSMTAIQMVDEYKEGDAVYTPRGVIINANKETIKTMLTALGITDFTKLDSFVMEE
jgi:hypothetical protein